MYTFVCMGECRCVGWHDSPFSTHAAMSAFLASLVCLFRCLSLTFVYMCVWGGGDLLGFLLVDS